MPAPGGPRNFKATPGSKTVMCSWAAPNTGGHALSYLVRCYLDPDDTFVKQFGTTKLSQAFTGLVNGVSYKFTIVAVNEIGSSSPEVKHATPAGPGPATIAVTMTKIGPDKIANTRPGESLADAPTLAVTGTNLDQPWSIPPTVDPNHVLEWVLYTDTTYSTVVGTDDDVVALTNEASTGFSITSPVAPGGADVDSNHLIGPWRLKATYVPDPTAPDTTAVAYSPHFFTTAVASIVVGTVSPNPMHDGDLVTVTGPDVGICDTAIVTIGGVSIDAPLVEVDQNTATFICPTFGFQLDAAGDVVLEYQLNGNVLSTTAFEVEWDTITGGSGGSGSTYVPPTGADIPSGDTPYPAVIHRWIFTDPAGIESDYTVPRNPDAMTSPFPTRNVVAKFTTAVTGQVLLTEGAPQLATGWTFSGKVADAAHYEKLRHWVDDRNARTVIIDHYGRPIECVLLNFNAVPERDIHRYWSHTYQVTALVIGVGVPTVVPT